MGPEETKEAVLFVNGERLGPISEIKTITETPIVPDSEESSRVMGIDLAHGQDFTVSFTPKWPHVSRKEFIRRLQKLGYSKKQAKKIAWETQQNKKTSYGHTFFLYSVGALPHYKELIWPN